MPVQYTFGQSFVAGLQYGLDRKERAERIQHQYALEQQRQAYQQQVLALQTRQEDRLQSESDRRAQEAEDSKVAVPTGEMRAIGGGVPGLAPVVERVPLDLAKYMSEQRQLAEARKQLEALGQARSEIFGIDDPEVAQALTGADIGFLTQQSREAAQIERDKFSRETQYALANRYRGGGGGSAGPSTKLERLIGEIEGLPPPEQLPYILGELQEFDNLVADQRDTPGDRERAAYLRLLKAQMQSGGGQQQALPSAPSLSLPEVGGAEFMRKLMQPEGRQGAVPPLVGGALDGSLSGPRPGPDGLFRIETMEEVQALPDGAIFVRDGVRYEKRGASAIKLGG